MTGFQNKEINIIYHTAYSEQKNEMVKMIFWISAVFVIMITISSVVAYQICYKPLPENVRATEIVVEKGKRSLTLLSEEILLKSYSISLGRSPVGKKQFEGDRRTPEGTYTIDWRNKKSGYHLALHISYPSRQDQANAERLGKSPGADIMIHGLPNGLGFLGPFHQLFDWTDGCIAVTDAEIEEIWRAVPDGTPIEIHP